MENINAYLPYLRGYDYTGKMPVVIDFYAAWCGPCQALSPLLERLAKEYEGRLKVIKVNVDKNEAMASAAGIRSIPTLMLVDIDGNIRRHVGGVAYSQLKAMADTLLS